MSWYFISELLHLYTVITSLLDQLANLQNLLVLDCRCNRLIDILAVVYSLTSLTTLYRRFNRIQELEAELGNLTNLTNLVYERTRSQSYMILLENSNI